MSVDMSKHFSTSTLIRFTLPTIAMMIFTSCYTIVDGFFVSNYAGKTALAARRRFRVCPEKRASRFCVVSSATMRPCFMA